MVRRDGNDEKATPAARETQDGMTWSHHRIVRVEREGDWHQCVWLDDDHIPYRVANVVCQQVTIRVGDIATVCGWWDAAIGHRVAYKLVIGECQVW